MGRPSKYEKIKPKVKAEYETGHIKPSPLSKKHNIPLGTLSGWIKDEKWQISEVKNKAITKSVEGSEVLAVVSEVEAEVHKEIVDEQVRRKNLIFNVTEQAIRLAGEMLKDNNKEVPMKIRESLGEGASIEKVINHDTTLDPLDIKNLIDGFDKASITLGINERHAKNNIAVQQVNENVLPTTINIVRDN